MAIRKPKKGESTYFNYKGYHNIVLMVEAAYKIQWVNVGSADFCSDALIWNDFQNVTSEITSSPTASIGHNHTLYHMVTGTAPATSLLTKHSPSKTD